MTEQPHRAVIYMANANEDAFLIDPVGNVMSAPASMHAILTSWARTQQLDAVLVADSIIPPEAYMPTVVLASPGRMRAQETKNRVKTFGWKWWMPLPSRAELLDMHRVAFPHLDREDCIARMELWGPIPRLVFADIEGTQQRSAWNELCKLNGDHFTAVLRSTLSSGSDAISHRILHECAAGQSVGADEAAVSISDPEYYLPGARIFASDIIMRWALECAPAEARVQVRLLIDATARVASFGAARGLLFGPMAIEVLKHGGTFTRRQVDPLRAADDATIDVHSHIEIQRFGDDDSLKRSALPRMLLVPLNKNYGAIDALFWDHRRHCFVPVNFFVGSNHAINGPALAKALRALGWTPELGLPKIGQPGFARVRFYWVVPDDARAPTLAPSSHPINPPFDSCDAILASTMEQFELVIPSATTLEIAKRVAAENIPSPEAILSRICKK